MTDKKINGLVRSFLNCLIPIGLAFLIGAIVILAIGENPLEAYGILFKKSFFTPVGFQNTLHYAGPMILTGLAIAITFKANVYNMGVEGSLLIGAFSAGIVGAFLTGLPSIPTKLICFAVAIVFGVAYALIAAFLKVKFRADEMVVTMMMNYALAKVLEYLATSVFRDSGSGYVCTPMVSDAAMFNRIFGKSRLTAFFFVVVLLLVIMYIVMKKSKLGYEVTAMGLNPEFAEATGMSVGKKIIIIMMISGALAGMGGFVYSLTTANCTANGDVAGFGFLALAVMIFGNWKPGNIAAASLLFGLFKCIAAAYSSIDINGDGVFMLAELGISSHLYRMLPYLVTLAVLAFTSKKSRAPKAEGIPYDKGSR